MKRQVVTMFITIMLVLTLVGCNGGSTTAGATGVGIGALFQNALTGAKRDLKAREEALVAAYNEGVETGMEKESLDQIAKEIERTHVLQAGVKTGEQFLGLDLNNPKQTGLAMGSLVELGLLIWGGTKLRKTVKELGGTKAAVAKFCGTNEPKVASELYDIVKEKTRST